MIACIKEFTRGRMYALVVLTCRDVMTWAQGACLPWCCPRWAKRSKGRIDSTTAAFYYCIETRSLTLPNAATRIEQLESLLTTLMRLDTTFSCVLLLCRLVKSPPLCGKRPRRCPSSLITTFWGCLSLKAFKPGCCLSTLTVITEGGILRDIWYRGRATLDSAGLT